MLSTRFSVNHLNPPVGKHLLIAHPYKLLAYKYWIYLEGFSELYSLIYLLLSVRNVRNPAAHAFFYKLEHINICHQFQLNARHF